MPKIWRGLTAAERARVRTIIRKAQWTHSTSEHYRDMPHSYPVLFQPKGFTKREWTRLSKLIRRCGQPRQWQGRRYKYLIVDGFCYWTMWPVLNRAKASTLDR